MTLHRLVLAAALALAAFAAQAQTLTKPAEFYFDEDRNTARLIVAVEGEGEPLAEQLVKQIERGRNRVEATAQLAHVAMGREPGRAGREALPGSAGQHRRTRHAGPRGALELWLGPVSRWTRSRPALAQWAELAKGFGSPSWVPPTLALVLWDLDRKAEATQWYAAAVRTEPLLWGDPANFPTLLPGWSDPERKRLAEVFAAWQADPPAWP